MNKKSPAAKTNKPGPSSAVIKLKTELHLGDFYAARRNAHRLLSSSQTTPEELNMVRRALKITWPDPIALCAGGVCLLFSIGIAFLAAY